MDPYAVSILPVTFVATYSSSLHASMVIYMQNPFPEFHGIIVCIHRLLCILILYGGCSEVIELLCWRQVTKLRMPLNLSKISWFPLSWLITLGTLIIGILCCLSLWDEFPQHLLKSLMWILYSNFKTLFTCKCTRLTVD